MSVNCQTLLNELGLDMSDDEQDDISQGNTRQITPSEPRIIINLNNNKQLVLMQGENPYDAVNEYCRINGLDEKSKQTILESLLGIINEEPSGQYLGDLVQDQNETHHLTQHHRNVYERLYALSKQPSQAKEEYNQNDQTLSNQLKLEHYYKKSNVPPGERLYQHGLIREKQKLENIKRQRDEYILQDRKHLTFKPQINQSDRKNYGSKPDFTQRMADKKLNQTVQEQECTFKPQITQYSKQLVEQNRRNNKTSDNVFDELYNKSTLSIKNKAKQSTIIEIRPSIIQFQSNRSITPKNFLGRLEEDLQNRKLQTEIMRNKVENTDMSTGRLLFQPTVGRHPKGDINPRRDIHEILYQDAKTIDFKITQLREVDQRQNEQNKPMMISKSQDIVYESRKAKIRQIFNTMDEDQDGVVYCTYQELTNLSRNNQQILYPIINRLAEKYQDGLEIDDFCEIVLREAIQLDNNAKYLLFEKPLSKYEHPQLTFMPKICQKSRKLCINKIDYEMCKCQVCRDALTNTNMYSKKEELYQ